MGLANFNKIKHCKFHGGGEQCRNRNYAAMKSGRYVRKGNDTYKVDGLQMRNLYQKKNVLFKMYCFSARISPSELCSAQEEVGGSRCYTNNCFLCVIVRTWLLSLEGRSQRPGALIKLCKPQPGHT